VQIKRPTIGFIKCNTKSWIYKSWIFSSWNFLFVLIYYYLNGF
jgi:hypothetical protein